jgi:hypothetical protein
MPYQQDFLVKIALSVFGFHAYRSEFARKGSAFGIGRIQSFCQLRSRVAELNEHALYRARHAP